MQTVPQGYETPAGEPVQQRSDAGGRHEKRSRELVDDLQLFQPAQKSMRGGMRFFLRRRTLHGVQNLVALIDAGPQLLLACKADGVVEMTDDASVPQMQLRCKIEVHRHGCISTYGTLGSDGATAMSLSPTELFPPTRD